MQDVAVDSSVLVAFFWDQEPDQHAKAEALVDGLGRGDYVFHVSTLVIIEVLAVIQSKVKDFALLHTARLTMEDWIRQGKMKLYPLGRARVRKAYDLALRFGLKMYDATVCQVADELNLDLYAFDRQIQRRFPKAKSP